MPDDTLTTMPGVRCFAVFPSAARSRTNPRIRPATLLAGRNIGPGSAEFLVMLDTGPYWIGSHLLKGSRRAAADFLASVDAMGGGD